MRKRILLLAACGILYCSGAVATSPCKTVQKGCFVSIGIDMKDAQGKMLYKTPEGEPTQFIQGVHAIVPALEDVLKGHRIGDRVVITLPPEKAWGKRNSRLVQRVPRSVFGNYKVKAGLSFQGMSRSGDKKIVVTVVSVDKNYVVIDGNSPLAGKTLTFDIKIKEVRHATAIEKQRMSEGSWDRGFR